MIYVGIDIAKNSHVAAIVSDNGEVLNEPFSFDNTIQGFTLLLNSMSKFDKNKVLIGLEATGHYGENLIQFLFQREYNIVQLNPLQTASARKSSIRKTKTDKADTFAIIKVLMYEDVRSISAKDIDHIALRSLCNARRSLVTLKSRSKIQLVSYVDQVFPELSAFFKNNLHINTSYTLLSEYSSPQEIKTLHLKHLSNLLAKASHGRYARDKAIELRKLATVSVGINNPIICLQIKLAIQQIQFFMSQLEVIESQMKEIVQRLNSRIMTIPGLNAISTAPILSIIGDFSRFSSPKQIIAYAGLDPTVIQSGQFQARYTRMSKRGNSLLRYALILSAFNVVKYDPTFKAYYDKKRAEGKSHYNALGHTASKLVRVMYALVMNGSDYQG